MITKIHTVASGFQTNEKERENESEKERIEKDESETEETETEECEVELKVPVDRKCEQLEELRACMEGPDMEEEMWRRVVGRGLEDWRWEGVGGDEGVACGVREGTRVDFAEEIEEEQDD